MDSPSLLSSNRKQLASVSASVHFRPIISLRRHPVSAIWRMMSTVMTYFSCLAASPAWGVDANFTYCGPKNRRPSQSWWLAISDDDTGAPEPELDYRRLVYRDVTTEGMPRTRVFVDRITDAGLSWTISASHTLLEMLVNPRKKLTVVADVKSKMMFFYTRLQTPAQTKSMHTLSTA
jgi:hypothetical protein